VSWTPDELVAFVGKVLYEVVERGLTLDFAFQKVKRGWRRLESFKVFYDVSFDAVKHYFLLRYLAARLLGSSGAKAVARAWFIYRADAVLYNRDMVARYRKRLLKRARGSPEEALLSVKELRGIRSSTYRRSTATTPPSWRPSSPTSLGGRWRGYWRRATPRGFG
jgi:16S rRNA (cytosine967-C5)-methyltransferase